MEKICIKTEGDYFYHVRSVYTQKVIVVESLEGNNDDRDPQRMVRHYYDMDGNLL